MKFLALLSFLSLCAAVPACADQASTHDEGRLYLSATSEVSGTPDLANISAGVVSEADTAKNALADNRKAMNGVFTALKNAGIKDRDIQTSSLQVNPVYAPYKQNVAQKQRITGYRVSNQVRATVRELNNLGAAVDALVSSGANSIGGISFGLSNVEDAQNTARKKAIAQLLKKAELYAQAAKIDLGQILELREQNSGLPRPQMAYARMESVAANAPTPIAPGQVSTSVTVSATFAIGPKQ